MDFMTDDVRKKLLAMMMLVIIPSNKLMMTMLLLGQPELTRILPRRQPPGRRILLAWRKVCLLSRCWALQIVTMSSMGKNVTRMPMRHESAGMCRRRTII
uniref:(northern house mosquito) hypothetical protein n=1 Tax=Culex pipiens TaxID=7175 RepID=A0A8D8CT56_CULPI